MKLEKWKRRGQFELPPSRGPYSRTLALRWCWSGVPSGTMIQRPELSGLPKLALAGCSVPSDLAVLPEIAIPASITNSGRGKTGMGPGAQRFQVESKVTKLAYSRSRSSDGSTMHLGSFPGAYGQRQAEPGNIGRQ